MIIFTFAFPLESPQNTIKRFCRQVRNPVFLLLKKKCTQEYFRTKKKKKGGDPSNVSKSVSGRASSCERIFFVCAFVCIFHCKNGNQITITETQKKKRGGDTHKKTISGTQPNAILVIFFFFFPLNLTPIQHKKGCVFFFYLFFPCLSRYLSLVKIAHPPLTAPRKIRIHQPNHSRGSRIARVRRLGPRG